MVDKNAKSVVTSFGMLIAAGIILLIVVPSADAQDFEPDRRPEEGLFLSIPINDGSFAPKSTSFTTAPTVGPAGPGQQIIYTHGGYFSAPFWMVSTGAPYTYADRAEWRTRPFTYSLWYRNTYTAFQANTRLFGTGYWSGSADTGYVGMIDTGYSGVPYNQFVVALGNGGSATAYSTGGISLGDIMWNHLVVSVDTTGARVYKNGVLISTVNGTFGTGATAISLYIGGSNINSGGCDLDEIRVYAGKALTTDEVVGIYQSGRTGQGDNQP